MHDFNYHRPNTLCDAIETMTNSVDGQFMAGGQTLIPVMKHNLAMPSDVIDLEAIKELKGIETNGDCITIGAMTPHAVVANSETIRKTIPALAELASNIGDPHVRNRGTIGGSVAYNDPSADYPAAVLGLGATIQTNKRAISADSFFIDIFETALEEGELITSIDIPVVDYAAYEKFANPASLFALAGVMVGRSDADVRVAVTGAGPCVFRAHQIERALEVNFSSTALDNISIEPVGLNTDIHASAKYRAHLITILARRAVNKAMKRTSEPK